MTKIDGISRTIKKIYIARWPYVMIATINSFSILVWSEVKRCVILSLLNKSSLVLSSFVFQIQFLLIVKPLRVQTNSVVFFSVYVQFWILFKFCFREKINKHPSGVEPTEHFQISYFLISKKRIICSINRFWFWCKILFWKRVAKSSKTVNNMERPSERM